VAKKSFKDLSPRQQRLVVAAGVVEVTLAAAAWSDLARRPAEQVRGPKWRWAIAIVVNVWGPLSYFIWGIRRSAK
jgi:Phospholipase_D-nuclease N-terminal